MRDGRVAGVRVLDQAGQFHEIYASAVLLATGGLGQVYSNTTNPAVATGDGVAMAHRAGAEISDMEFVQFHPTALYLKNAPRFLLSEALRGEGAYLRNFELKRFMPKYHELAELAPRDVVARAIAHELELVTASRCRRLSGPDASRMPIACAIASPPSTPPACSTTSTSRRS